MSRLLVLLFTLTRGMLQEEESPLLPVLLPLLERADAFQVQPMAMRAPTLPTARMAPSVMGETLADGSPVPALDLSGAQDLARVKQKTWFPKSEDTAIANKKWYVVDAAENGGLRLGRMASEVAKILIGKHKPTFTPGADVGDMVIIINAEKIKVTGKKYDDKLYKRHSGRPGGMKIESFKELQARIPERIVEKAIVGMLPKNSHGRELFRHLKVYKGPEHPHEAQTPEPLSFPNIKEVVPQQMVRGQNQRPKDKAKAAARAAAAQMRMTPEPVMKVLCDLTGKKSNNANRVSFSNKHWAYLQKPNLQTKKLYSPALQKYVKVKIATSTLRTIRKNGLDETAKKYGVDLSKFAIGNVVQAEDAPAPEVAVEGEGQRSGEVTMLLENADLLTEEEIASLPDEDEIAVAELLDEEEEDDDESPAPVSRAGTVTMKHRDFFKRVASAENGRLRLCVFRSNNHIYGQIIDDSKEQVVAAASTLEKDLKEKGGQNCAAATLVGQRLAERAKSKGIEKVFFDRNGRQYHGRIAALADGAREGGLNF
jgi:large subunit ribosomal protein L13